MTPGATAACVDPRQNDRAPVGSASVRCEIAPARAGEARTTADEVVAGASTRLAHPSLSRHGARAHDRSARHTGSGSVE